MFRLPLGHVCFQAVHKYIEHFPNTLLVLENVDSLDLRHKGVLQLYAIPDEILKRIWYVHVGEEFGVLDEAITDVIVGV